MPVKIVTGDSRSCLKNKKNSVGPPTDTAMASMGGSRHWLGGMIFSCGLLWSTLPVIGLVGFTTVPGAMPTLGWVTCAVAVAVWADSMAKSDRAAMVFID
jgi:hypothetical protein